MKKIVLIGWLALLLAGCDDLPIYGGEHGGGDDLVAAASHASYPAQLQSEIRPGAQH